ncbi:hypothetical protein XBO1_2650034 [Xenorhabdus bovienii str. oregonense]|uniref:Uncharacterized protein n=1 Tax=Xenorhabdus bovienii str. oregonense TaxID=1398202 RepID=A0A077NYR7_XENBV|nr:hypothetical protein XBO1_2650034 [Xenorhabdus bovienii str. oregonense]
MFIESNSFSEPLKALLAGLEAEHDFTKAFPEHRYRNTEEEHQRWLQATRKKSTIIAPCSTYASCGRKRCSVFAEQNSFSCFSNKCHKDGLLQQSKKYLISGVKNTHLFDKKSIPMKNKHLFGDIFS